MRLRRAAVADLERVVVLQRAAYDRNRALLGVEPMPLTANYAEIFGSKEVWLAESDCTLDGVLMLEPRPDDLLIWSIAAAPEAQKKGVGRTLLAAAEDRAHEIGRDTIRLYTGTRLTHLVAWYRRHGYATERLEELPDRSITHMVKRLPVTG